MSARIPPRRLGAHGRPWKNEVACSCSRFTGHAPLAHTAARHARLDVTAVARSMSACCGPLASGGFGYRPRALAHGVERRRRWRFAGRRILRWNRVADGTERALLTGHTDVTGCTFSPDGALLATVSNDGIVRLWQVTSGRCIALYAWRVL
jgi:hypothetical protein